MYLKDWFSTKSNSFWFRAF